MNRLCVKQYKRIGPVEWMKLNEIEWRVEKSTTKKPLKPKNEAYNVRKIREKKKTKQKRERAKKTYPLYLYTSFRNWVRSNLHITESLVFIIHLLISTHGSVRTHTIFRFALSCKPSNSVFFYSSRLTALIIKWIKFSAYEKRIKDVIWKKAAHKSSPHALHIRMKGGREKENWCEC